MYADVISDTHLFRLFLYGFSHLLELAVGTSEVFVVSIERGFVPTFQSNFCSVLQEEVSSEGVSIEVDSVEVAVRALSKFK